MLHFLQDCCSLVPSARLPPSKTARNRAEKRNQSMKSKLLILSLVSLGLAGCGPSKTINSQQAADFRRVASTGLVEVFVVRVDGYDYIVADNPYGIAICQAQMGSKPQ